MKGYKILIVLLFLSVATIFAQLEIDTKTHAKINLMHECVFMKDIDFKAKYSHLFRSESVAFLKENTDNTNITGHVTIKPTDLKTTNHGNIKQ
ncbi:hypothetical protein P8625_03520 [Tenacibaculum tangerinum]|uniref:Organic solvent tolerance-like N-terminal domain-containing protein n=1 Tax=Tenacibaculum tangerinum TaxID=3038772 RepID=A0ABY8L6H9_9FLAO|nr:hypothetical protein [Tenacibaculum tangerinum]WGH76247.1 hypothetical protein P8625_03520 [Tenacibaculum tangerinum]